MKFIDNPNLLPKNYKIYIEGVKTRAEVFILLEFLPLMNPTIKYPTKKDIITYLECLGDLRILKKML